MKYQNSVAITIPAFNDEQGLLKFLPILLNEIDQKNSDYEFQIVVVDDGSRIPVCQENLRSIQGAYSPRVFLLRHPVNLGQGAALQTGLEFARQRIKADYFVTMDSDGQHSEEDLFPLIAELRSKNLDIVFGNRFGAKASSGMPQSRKMLLKLAVAFEHWLTGVKLNDAHNGFRVFNSKCAALISLKNNRMAHATEFKQIVKRTNLKYGEFPVKIKYTEETLSRGQRNTGSLIILKDLLKMYLFERQP